VDKKISDCDWSYLKTLKTLKKPPESLPRLKDLLKYLAKPGLEEIWVLLDIKVHWLILIYSLKKNTIDNRKKLDDDPENLFNLIASTIRSVASSRPWNQRLVLGCWLVSQRFGMFPTVVLIQANTT
jgi:phosphatidylglycerol phospholipase C